MHRLKPVLILFPIKICMLAKCYSYMLKPMLVHRVNLNVQGISNDVSKDSLIILKSNLCLTLMNITLTVERSGNKLFWFVLM